jgi:hypothetical protein
VEELLDVAKLTTKNVQTMTEIVQPAIKAAKPTVEVIKSRLHTIETIFYGYQTLLSGRRCIFVLRRRQTADEMVRLRMFHRAVLGVFCFTCIAYEKVI